MSFVVIEGLDGSGKSTQTDLLKNYFNKNNISFEYVHFPTYTSPVFGDLIARFLRGEFGEKENVDPYLVALLFAGDRYNEAKKIKRWLNNNIFVLNDRYVYSNIAFQCAKTKSVEDANKLLSWILDLEYNYFKIPKPDLNIYLDVPINFIEKCLKERTKISRSYLQGNSDIHETDMSFQSKVREMYLLSMENDENFVRINCADENNNILTPKQISDLIIKEIINKHLI